MIINWITKSRKTKKKEEKNWNEKRYQEEKKHHLCQPAEKKDNFPSVFEKEKEKQFEGKPCGTV